jgi:hypothetical protein
MLKWIIRNRIAAFEKQLGYDMTYARELLEIDTRAFFAFARVQKLSGYRRDVAPEVAYAAKIVGAMSEDCGPCTQLCVTMALNEKVDPKTIAAIVRGDDAALPADVLLAVRFTRASLAHSPDADDLRDEIVATWGKRALVTLAFAMVGARLYPTLKYALGHGRACQRVTVAGTAVPVVRSAA